MAFSIAAADAGGGSGLARSSPWVDDGRSFTGALTSALTSALTGALTGTAPAAPPDARDHCFT
jgi:hypothetical protein